MLQSVSRSLDLGIASLACARGNKITAGLSLLALTYRPLSLQVCPSYLPEMGKRLRGLQHMFVVLWPTLKSPYPNAPTNKVRNSISEVVQVWEMRTTDQSIVHLKTEVTLRLKNLSISESLSDPFFTTKESLGWLHF
jgi:hypothetical protein